jgi:hypothetical protein
MKADRALIALICYPFVFYFIGHCECILKFIIHHTMVQLGSVWKQIPAVANGTPTLIILLTTPSYPTPTRMHKGCSSCKGN